MKPILNKLRYTAGILMLGGALTLGLYGLTSLNNQSFARDGHDDDDDDDRHSGYYQSEGASGRNMIDTNAQPALAATYQTECGDCHMAYPAGLLPSRSWEAIMATLPDHFGDDASLDPATQADILTYLSANSANGAKSAKSAKSTKSDGNAGRMLRGMAADATPLRITELPYFKRKHRELPMNIVKDNPEISSMSQCDSCHQGAAKGQFDEDNVVIPGIGRWDD